MLRKITSFFSKPARKSAIQTAPRSLLNLVPEPDDVTPRYPPFLEGLPFVPAHQILATQKEFLQRINLAIKLSPEEVDKYIYPVIEIFARYAHLLPASENHHHKGTGGLLRHSLEVAFWATQCTERKAPTFNTLSLQEAKELSKRWQAAVFIAGLFHDAGKPASDLRVTNRDGTLTWNGTSIPLHDWLEKNRIDRYFIYWNKGRKDKHLFYNPLILEKLLPNTTREWLSEYGGVVSHELFESFAEQPGTNMIKEIVCWADKESTAKDQNISGGNGISVGGHGPNIISLLVDAMRRLISDGTWKANEKGARVWVSDDGVYLAWPQAATEISTLLSKDGAQGIPRHPNSIAEILIDNNVASPYVHENTTHYFWPVAAEILQTTGKDPLVLKCLKITDIKKLYVDEESAPTATTIEIGSLDRQKVAGKGKPKPKQARGVVGKKIEQTPPVQASLDLPESTAPEQKEDIAEIESAPANEAAPANNDKGAATKESTAEAADDPKPAVLSKPKPKLKPLAPAKAIPEPSQKEMSKPELREVGKGAVTAMPDFAFDTGAFSAPVSAEDEDETPDPSPKEQVVVKRTAPPKLIASVVDDKAMDIDVHASLSEKLKNGGETLSSILDAMKDAEINWGDVLHQTVDGVMVSYPDKVEPYGEPGALLSFLTSKGFVEVDPTAPARKVRQIGQVKGLLLNKELSNLLIAAGSTFRFSSPKKHPEKPSLKSKKPKQTPKTDTESVKVPKADFKKPAPPAKGFPTTDVAERFLTHIRNEIASGRLQGRQQGEWLELPLIVASTFGSKADIGKSPAEMRNALAKNDNFKLTALKMLVRAQ